MDKESIKKFAYPLGFMFVIGLLIILILAVVNQKQSTVIIDNSGHEVIKSQGLDRNQLQWNNINLIDSTTFDTDKNICTAQRYGMTVQISPCATQGLLNEQRVQYVNFSWNGNQARNISWIFVYDGQIRSGSIYAYINSSYSYTISNYSNQFVSNYLVAGIKNYSTAGTPSYKCGVGNLNNTQMYLVNFLDGSSNYYCFTNATVVNATSIRISGNADIGNLITVNAYKPQWIDITNKIQYLGTGLLQDNRSYYKVEDVLFNVGDSILTKWVYVPKDSKAGKWHILGFDSGVGLINSVQNDQYLYVDPWYNSSWIYKKAINITAITNLGMSNYTVPINITWAGNGKMRGDFGDVRFVNASESGLLPYWFYNNSITANNNSALAYVYIRNLTNQTIYMYYGNPTATNVSDLASSFQFADDFLTQCSGASAGGNWSQGGTSSYSLSNGVCSQTHSSGNALTESTYLINSSVGAEMGMRIKVSSDQASGYMWLGFKDAGNTGFSGFNLADVADEGGSNLLYQTYLGAATQITRTTSYTNWQETKIVTNTSSTTFSEYGTTQATSTTNIPNRNLALVFGSNSAAHPVVSVDWMYMRPKANIDPTVTFGSETVSGGTITTQLSTPSNSALFNVSSITFGFNVTAVNYNVSNYTLNIWYSNTTLYYTYFNYTTGSSFNFTKLVTLPDNSYVWGAVACGNNSNGDTGCNTAANRTFSINTVPPVLILNSLQNVTALSLPTNATLNVTASDTSLDRCAYYTSDNVTWTYYTCNVTQNILFYTAGNKNITVFANDSYSNSNTSTYYFSVHYMQVNQTILSNPANEGDTVQFNLTLNSSVLPIGSAEAYLTLNNTIYAYDSKTVIDSNSVMFSKSIFMSSGFGSVAGNNLPYNWTWNSTDYSNTQTSTKNLTVFSPSAPAVNVVCPNGTNTLYNFTFQDEENLTSLTATAVLYNINYGFGSQTNYVANGSLSNVGSFGICVNSTYAAINLSYGEIQYRVNNYESRRFYLFAGQKTNVGTSKVVLYDLFSGSNVIPFTFIAESQSLIPYSGYYTALLRWYPNLNNYYVVDMGKTDISGKTIMKVELTDVDYRVGLYDTTGNLITLRDAVRFSCSVNPCEYTIASSNSSSYSTQLGVQQSLDFNNNTGFVTYTYSDPSQTTKTMNLTVYKMSADSDTIFCSTTQSGFTGILACDLSNQSGQFQAVVYRSASPPQPQANKFIDLGQATLATISPIISLIIGFLSSMILGMIGVYMGIIPALILTVVGSVVGVFFGVINWAIAGGVIVLSIAIYLILKKL